MKGIGTFLVVAALSGCTSVKVVQRDGCWVRRTEKWPGRISEEIGPCALPAPPWVEDRLTRLVQECVARADYRWQSRALAAWSRGEKLPEQDEGNLLKECMTEASGGLITQKEKETLEARLTEVSADRDALRARADDDRTHLRASNDKLAEFLGEAAKKPSPPATATATASSDGSATTESATTPQVSPVAIVSGAPAAGSSEPASRAIPLRRARLGKQEARPAVLRSKPQPECDAAKPAAGADGAASAAGAPTTPAANGEGTSSAPRPSTDESP